MPAQFFCGCFCPSSSNEKANDKFSTLYIRVLNLQNVHSALKLLPQLVGILRITERRSRNRCSVHDSSSHQSDTPYTPPWSASTEGHFFTYPTGGRNGYAYPHAPGFPQQISLTAFCLPDRRQYHIKLNSKSKTAYG